MGFLQTFLSNVFDQRGGTWAGLATLSAILMAWVEFIFSGFNRPLLNATGVPVVVKDVVVCMPGFHPFAPSWWIIGVTSVYTIILGAFVLSKQGTYYVDSRFNSPQDKSPEKKA